MAARGDIYTVHQNVNMREPSDRIVLVREGFAFWAFVFHALWLISHRCWRMAITYLLLLVLLERVSVTLGLSHISMAVLQLGLQFWLGGIANDCRRASLARRGYTEIAVVCGESPLLAERRYFDRLHPVR